jgi:hypothetical protein
MDMQITFVPDQDGAITKLIVKSSGQRIEAPRK